jgi:cytoskeletal protein CcmA (bactofilin family)
MFPKKPSSTTRTTTDLVSSTGTFSVLGADLAVKGDINATADLHIDGRIEGDITCAALVQGEGSEIIGAITAQSARLAGTVRGTITVVALTIQRSAHIVGDVNYETLTIEQGARVEGRFAQSGAKEPLLIGN